VNPWIARYIFPGGYIPSLAQIAEATSAADLWVTDVEVLRLHYAHTLDAWLERFMAHRGVLAELYDEHFLRTWEFYLASCAMNFRHGRLSVFQVQLTRQVGALPIVRDYMVEEERRLTTPRRRALSIVRDGPAATRRKGAGTLRP
jgi:cyclopropane-fatty-acyl-phospholipid synthase